MAAINDAAIIALLQKRDEAAISEIRSKYGNLCFRIAEQMLHNAEDAEECVSEMLLAVWNSVPPQVPRNLEAYLVTLLRRAATDRLRSLTRQKRGGTQVSEVLDELADVLPSSENVEKSVELKELTAALNAWIRTLPEESGRIFMERYYLSEPLQSVAARHGLTEDAVKNRLKRIRSKLKEYLRKEGLL